MLGSAVIVFREVLEAALIIAIVLGASRGIAGRGRWVFVGVAAGPLGALVVAASAGVISDALGGRGQELFNAGVLLAAVAMLAWHNVWMSAHARQLTAEMRRVGHDVSVGAKPLTLLEAGALAFRAAYPSPRARSGNLPSQERGGCGRYHAQAKSFSK